MSNITDGGFTITRDKTSDSPGNGIGFKMRIWNGGGFEMRLSKTDVEYIRREAGRALKELKHEQDNR
ncbi:hypothetical protein OZX73_05450 [Bifidobacterium sp. ESL0775]|uniref:hypothetical protein n=1 Tax=Bifidobacterium sp. ESL0775 TaxID=2983230 RepID=UPI0023FA49D6|nr:hypothetical protein [Bifidobacterium sp. ESL0775]WEV68738.1 hypothetical protein OZX73_05450 [Bifidobacterium sp. ESL0775]